MTSSSLDLSELENGAAKILCQLKCQQGWTTGIVLTGTSDRSTAGECKREALQCTECLKPFPTPSKLTTHLRTHSGERPYGCRSCGKAFRQSSHLRVHERTVHTLERRHRCNDCGRTFAQAPHLTSHRRARHQQSRPFSCSECPRTFVQSNHLTAHERLHSGERPYACDDCGKAFRQSGHLRIHTLTHSGERPHECDSCGARFKQKQHRSKHTCRPKSRTSVKADDAPHEVVVM